jgi:hypothetical protein
VVLALSVVMTVRGPGAPVVANPPGIRAPVLALELAATPDEVFRIIGPPGDPARPAAVAAMRAVTHPDFVFLLAYSTFYAGIFALLHARSAGPTWLAPVGWALAATLAVADALENVEILRLLDAADATAMGPALAALRPFTLLKWNAIFAASALLAPWTWRIGVGWRVGGPAFALAAVAGFAWVIHLPAIEWSLAPTAVAWTATWLWAVVAVRRARPA